MRYKKNDTVMGVDETVRDYQTGGKPVTKKTDAQEPEGTCPPEEENVHNVRGINFKKQTLDTKAVGPGFTLTKPSTETLIP